MNAWETQVKASETQLNAWRTQLNAPETQLNTWCTQLNAWKTQLNAYLGRYDGLTRLLTHTAFLERADRPTRIVHIGLGKRKGEPFGPDARFDDESVLARSRGRHSDCTGCRGAGAPVSASIRARSRVRDTHR